MQIEELVQYLLKRLGDDEFITPARLIKSRILGGRTSVNTLLKSGKLPYLQISPKKFLIAKDEIETLLRKSIKPGKAA